MCKIRIISDAPGQTCNRFWSYVDSVAWAIEHNTKVRILYWDKSISDFALLRNNKYVSFPLYSSLGISLFGYEKWNYWSHRLFPNNKLASWFVYKSHIGQKMGFVQGWPTRCNTELLLKHKDIVVRFFEPNNDISIKATECIDAWKNKGYFVVGVHIRRGDYADFLNGKCYFSDEEIVQYMCQIKELHKEKKVCFYLASNEKLHLEKYSAFEIITPYIFNAAYDLKSLSLCDCIVGPISTFSRWASFVGNVPLCFLRKRVKLTTKTQFSPIRDYYHFANGKEISSVYAIEQRYKQICHR